MSTPAFATHLSTLSSSRREGLTAIFRKAQGRGLPEASGWLNPEDSIGPYLGRNKWTRFKFWEAVGPARDAFYDIAPKIKRFLEDTVEPISSRVTWSMYMVGRAPSQASPSIIFCCEVLWHRRQVRDIIKESGILDDYPPGIKTGHLPRPPAFDQLVPLGVRDVQVLSDRGEMIALTAHARSACGSQIFENTHGTSSAPLSAVATIGGVIRLGRNYYYMTAAHTILPSPDSTGADEEWPAKDPCGSALSLDGNEDMCITSDSNLSTDDLRTRHSPSRVSERSDENRYLRDDIVRQWSLEHHHEAEEPLSPLADPGKLSLVRTGTPFMSSMDEGSPATGLDYALIELKSRHHSMENVVQFGRKHEKAVNVYSFFRSVQRDMDVVAVTSRGTIKGRISGTPVYSSTPGQRSYNRMFKVSLGSPLQNGDCGTWVVDATNGHLFGHVVLGSPGAHTALLIPFADVFDDIVSRTGRSPMFPTARDDGKPAETRTPANPRDLALARLIRRTVYSMSEIRAVESPRDDALGDEPSPAATISGIGTRFSERQSDLSTLKEDPEGLSKQAVRERSNGTSLANTSRKVSFTFLHAVHEELASQQNSDGIERTEDAANDSMRQEDLDPRRQRRNSRAPPSEPSSGSHPNLSRDPARKEGSAVLIESTRPQSDVPHHERPLERPVPLKGVKFRDVLMAFSKAPLNWENTELLDKALKEIDLDAITAEAEEGSRRFIFEARTKGDDTKPEWGYQDCVIRALSRYFRRSFFTRIKRPPCEACPAKLPTIPRGNARPNPEEKAGKAQVVELYQCAEKHCQAYTRFPRYWDPGTLLRNPRGRAGEAANCFGMLCRALGSRVRWVWNAEDRIWTEVYSEHQGRWVHVDACEGAWDDPLMYTEARGKKLSYCIAFSVDGAVDVTRRYVRGSDHASPRTQCTETELLSILYGIKSMRRSNMSKEVVARLKKEDTVEAQQLESYLAPSNEVGMAGPPQDNTMMLGPSGGKQNGEDIPITSATSYPGQEWNPFGDLLIEDDE